MDNQNYSRDYVGDYCESLSSTKELIFGLTSKKNFKRY